MRMSLMNLRHRLSHFMVVCAIVSLAGLSACAPYEFTMGGKHITKCSVITSLQGVDQGSRYATIRDTGAVNMNYYGATQYLLTMDMKLVHGEGFRMLIRPVVEQHDVRDSGLVLMVTKNGTWLSEAGKELMRRTDVAIQPGAQMPVSLLSENGYMQIVLGCDTVFKGNSTVKESDDVVVQALEHTEIQLIQPDWAGLPDR